ncbi:MAG: ParB/RepB/Spo0J family partition protein, partial [Chloroflexi bacterium]|nr:ParB/RepB/Spo0J family partition protein [Chloroflexota bacterium]
MEFKEIRLLNLIPARNLRTERVPDIQELADSIKQHGLLQPIRVRHLYGETYQVIAGHRRVQAFRTLGMKAIPSIVVTERDEAAAVQSIVENLQREDLTPLELARGIQDLAKGFNLDAEAISRLVSKSPERVRTWLRFSSLPDDVLSKLESGEGRTQSVTGLTPRHIEPFVRDLPSEEAVQSDEQEAARYEERVSDVRELQEEVERRDVRINAHMADAIARETREGDV